MASNTEAVDHVLPVVGQARIGQCLKSRVPYAQFGPAPEPDIDRVPLPIALMHVAPWAADLRHAGHAVEKTSIVA